jgi:hypothetical protein
MAQVKIQIFPSSAAPTIIVRLPELPGASQSAVFFAESLAVQLELYPATDFLLSDASVPENLRLDLLAAAAMP